MEIEKTITLVMTLEEAEDSVLALKTLPQIEDADITFTDDVMWYRPGWKGEL